MGTHVNWFSVIHTGEITLIALGPLTNLAMAMRLDEQFASGLKELYIMGGNVEGNIAEQSPPFHRQTYETTLNFIGRDRQYNCVG